MPTDSHQPHTLTRVLLPWNLNLCTQNTVTKQYNLVLANRRWCLVAGKLTVGLVSHWPRVPDIRHSGSPSKGSRPRRGIRASVYAFLWSTVDFTFTFTQNHSHITMPQGQQCFSYHTETYIPTYSETDKPMTKPALHTVKVDNYISFRLLVSLPSYL